MFRYSKMGTVHEYLAVQTGDPSQGKTNLSFRRQHQCRWPPELHPKGIFTTGHLEKEQEQLLNPVGGAGAVAAPMRCN